ncbi:MMPL family transporter [Conexibacter sp. CPCC 206217]|uniref:MMPL family transporter n=1 Tax=Conexibacter sp. CPCC 206217 TaxID=3064574 RepID=UPI00271F7243|nr:MMPL family transporter [Conexibacter sp. CPCC 206217]MDO8210270.1 MMPL family transporter [Conexibacter sp. CPCC 206217]
MRNLARWAFTHRRIVLGVWLVIVVGISLVHGAAGSDYKDSFKLSGTDSADALALLQQAAPRAAGDSDQIVIATRTGTVTDPAVAARVRGMLDEVATLPHVGGVTSPLTPTGRAQISRDGTIAYATVTFDEQANDLPTSAIDRVIDTARAIDGNGLQVELGGQAIEAANPPGAGGAGFGFLAAAIVLFIVFGSLFAMALPLVTAGFALGTGIATIGLLSHVITMASFSSELSLLIGLGVGVDYALFIVTRFRQGLLRGLEPEQAAVEALDTSGRAVLFAGVTVCIALLGMFALGVSFLYGVAIAASIVVAFTVVTALTLLPALLGFLGPRVLSRRVRRRLAAAGSLSVTDESPGWGRWAARLQSRPALFATAAAVLMLVIAIPFLSIRLGSSDQGSDPKDTTTRQAYDLLAKGFGPGFNGPLQLVAAVPDRAAEQEFGRVVVAAGRAPDVVATTQPVVLPGRDGRPGVAVAQVVPSGSPQDASTTDLVDHLRDTTIPQTTAGSDLHVLVGGDTAIFEDFSHVLADKLPLFIGVVVLLSFLLLMAVFRSIVVPAIASLMNLLSAAAGFGVITAIFQWGWGAELIGIDRTGPIEAFLPVMVFAILFGLSMDYEVFLVSRIYEEWHRRQDNREAIVHGLAATGRTITAAAAIMVLVFAAFVLGGERIIKLFGVGLASAVLLDALVVRSVLVPGLMLLIGRANWWLPGWLERLLPHLNVEGSAVEEEVGAGAAAGAGVPRGGEPAAAAASGSRGGAV